MALAHRLLSWYVWLELQMLCLSLLPSPAGAGLLPGHPTPQPCCPSCLFPLKQHRQPSFGAGEKQVLEPRAMEPRGGWESTGEAQKAHPCPHSSTPCCHFLPPLIRSMEKAVLLVTGACLPAHCLSPALGTLQEGGGVAGAFLLPQPLLQSWAAASTSILSPTTCMRRQGECTSEPLSLLGRGLATHNPGHFAFSCRGWYILRAGWASSSSRFPVQAGTGAAAASIAW